MAENKYRVSGSAYGYGNLFGSDKNGFDDDFMSQYVTNDNASYSQGMTTSPTSAPAPVPATPQVNQLEMGNGSDPRGNANDISNKAITGQTSVGMYGGGAPGTEFDDPFGTGSMQSFQDARNAPRGYDAYEQAMDQAGEDMRLRGYGDLLGFKQSGLQSFRLADPVLNEDLFLLAEKEAKIIESQNYSIERYMPLLKLYDRADILNDLV